MGELVEFFVRHYTLVLDNDQQTYREVNDAARQAIRDSGVTRSAYRAMSRKERETEFARTIGEAVMSKIEEYVDEDVPDSREGAGAMLVREVLLLGDGDVIWELGAHYTQDFSDVGHMLDEDPDVEIIVEWLDERIGQRLRMLSVQADGLAREFGPQELSGSEDDGFRIGDTTINPVGCSVLAQSDKMLRFEHLDADGVRTGVVTITPADD